MRGQDGSGEVAVADGVADEAAAEDLVLVAGEVGDLAVVGAPLGVAEADGRGDLVLDAGLDVLDGAVDNSGTLAAITSY